MQRQNEFMQPIDFADILSTELQLAHTGYLTHALCLQGTATLLFNGAEFPLQAGDCLIIRRSELAQIANASPDFRTITIYVTPEFTEMATPLSNYGMRGQMMLFNDPVMHLNARQQERCYKNMEYVRTRYEEKSHHFYLDLTRNAVECMIIDFFDFHAEIYETKNDLSHQGAQLMSRFMELLEQGEYRTHRDIAYFANRLCVTPAYLSETCKSISGYGAAYWINRYTALEISRLLRDRTLTRADIAYRFEFSSVAYLSRYIRQNLGVSASEIRGGER